MVETSRNPYCKGTTRENDTDSETGHRIDRPDGPQFTGIGLVDDDDLLDLERWMVGRVIAR